MHAASATLEPPNLWTFQASKASSLLRTHEPTLPGRRNERAELGADGWKRVG